MRTAIIFSLLFFACIFTAAAEVVTSEELANEPEEYDGETVTFKGEAIGEVMIRGDFAWINVGDETGAIGVFCPQEHLSEIEHEGSYKVKGDIISVRGIFHQSCPQHGGDTDIHAEKITLIQKGEEVSHSLEPWKVKLSIILSAIAFALIIINLIVRRLR